MQSANAARKYRAYLFSAKRNDEIEIGRSDLVSGLGSVPGNVDAQLGEGLDRVRTFLGLEPALRTSTSGSSARANPSAI